MKVRDSALNLRDGFLGLFSHVRNKAVDIFVLVAAAVVLFFLLGVALMASAPD
jgi:hypothetical protein